MPTTQLIQTVSPGTDCQVASSRPAFQWRLNKRDSRARQRFTYALRLVALKEGQDAAKILKANTPVLALDNLTSTKTGFPRRAKSLVPDRVYAYQVSAITGAGKVLGKSDISLFFVEPKDLPFRYRDLVCCSDGLLSDDFGAWKTAYGDPGIHADATGCLEAKGSFQVKGTLASGDAVYQELGASSGFAAGRRYTLSFCARMDPKLVAYARFRVLAFNGALSDTGVHAQPSAAIAVIGETSRVTSTSWTRVVLPTWMAHKDYQSIAILAVSDNAHDLVYGEVSNICLQETETDDCGLFLDALPGDGSINLPAGWEKYAHPDHDPEAKDVEYDSGRLVDIFGPPFDDAGQSNWYREGDPCVSVGGSIPPEAVDGVKEKENVDLGGGLTPADIEGGMSKILDELGEKWNLTGWKPIPGPRQQGCEPFKEDTRYPFGGRDIIYVHGFRPDHVINHIIQSDSSGVLKDLLPPSSGDDPCDNFEGVDQRWPEDPGAFRDDGVFKTHAECYWESYIDRYLGAPEQMGNRYLVVAFNSSQRLMENIHAVLWQISRAMNHGDGVVYNEKDPRGKECFGREYVLVSHSTGAPVSDVAMSIANSTASDAGLRAIFGDVKYIADRAAAHISLHGAIAGSEMASLAVVGANLAGLAAGVIDAAVDVGIAVGNSGLVGMQLMRAGLASFGISSDAIASFFDGATDSLVAMAQAATSVVNRSILIDLSPIVTRFVWGPVIDRTPVPVLTVAGGHPSDYGQYLAAKLVLPGLDDGVVNANSQSGSPSVLPPDRYGYVPPLPRVFDMGIPIQRSVPYFVDQAGGIGLAAYGSIPWLSPTGMVQPVLATLMPLPRYRNHYPFIQSAADHNNPIVDTSAYMDTLGTANYEESLVVDQAVVFDSGLLSEAIVGRMRQTVRGQDLVIVLQIPIPVITLFPPSFKIEQLTLTFTIPIWRRRYHTLFSTSGADPVNDRRESYYAYRYVLR